MRRRRVWLLEQEGSGGSPTRPQPGRQSSLTPAQQQVLRLQEGGNGAVGRAIQRGAGEFEYPGYDNIAYSSVRAQMWEAWKETVNATTPTSRREQGFWVQWHIMSLANANGNYRIRGEKLGPTLSNDKDGSVLLDACKDDGDWHTVAAFHTHTPTKYRTEESFTARPAGPTDTDNAAHNKANVVGIVRDYVGKNGEVPPGHPLWAESEYFHTGRDRRL